jgi:hypothetical protein
MRKLAMTLATAMLVAAVAAPTTAAPEKHEHLDTWYASDCPCDIEWTAPATGGPASDILGDTVTPPARLCAGDFTLIDPNGTHQWAVTDPQGLGETLFGPCHMVLVEDDPTFSLEVENAYFVVPGAR